jgi:hypothetical protein
VCLKFKHVSKRVQLFTDPQVCVIGPPKQSNRVKIDGESSILVERVYKQREFPHPLRATRVKVHAQGHSEVSLGGAHGVKVFKNPAESWPPVLQHALAIVILRQTINRYLEVVNRPLKKLLKNVRSQELSISCHTRGQLDAILFSQG